MHEELTASGIGQKTELNADHQELWWRFHDFCQRLMEWNQQAEDLLSSSHPLSSLASHLSSSSSSFPYLSLPLASALSARMGVVERWQNGKESRAYAKRSRAKEIRDLLKAREEECGLTYSPLTLKLQQQLDKADEWSSRLKEAKESKADIPALEALLNEVLMPKEKEGKEKKEKGRGRRGKTDESELLPPDSSSSSAPAPSPLEAEEEAKVWADKKDISLAQSLMTRYCLCRCRWEEGVFMIGKSKPIDRPMIAIALRILGNSNHSP